MAITDVQTMPQRNGVKTEDQVENGITLGNGNLELMVCLLVALAVFAVEKVFQVTTQP